MNPNADPPPPPPRLSTSCVRHPEEQFATFCPSCLCERLSVLEPSPAATASSSSRKPPIAAAAIKSIFKSSSGTGKRTGFFPELRRSKSFSASKNEGLSGTFEPQRKSCDVRARNSLGSLFNQEPAPNLSTISSSVLKVPVFESEEENKPEPELEPEPEIHYADYIEIIEEEPNVCVATVSVIEDRVEEIVEEHEQEDELKPIKDHIDLDSQTKRAPARDLKVIAGSFWSTASDFSKKLQKWRKKQKLKKNRTGVRSARFPVQAQSEMSDYALGRSSCDSDPRFSLDAARMSYDDPRYSFDAPRASWDGHLIGRAFPKMPTMVSVVEDAPIHRAMLSDTRIHVENGNVDESLHGGSVQTMDYYPDMSNSIRKTDAAVIVEKDEMKSVSNAKVSPANTDYVNVPKLVVPDMESSSNSNSLRYDYSETTKKSWRWSKAWNILGFINKRSVNKDEDEDRYSRVNVVERSYSESWSDLRGEQNEDASRGFNPRILRSNSSVSCRNSSSFDAPFIGARKLCRAKRAL